MKSATKMTRTPFTRSGDKPLVLVTGAQGLLGREVTLALWERADECRILALPRQRFDITRPEHYNYLVENNHRPAIIINCAAYTKVMQANVQRWKAWQANTVGVSLLAEYCSLKRIKLVHVSTDFVFGLERHREMPYHEDSAVGPTGHYGWTKLAGECEILRVAQSHAMDYCIVRTAGLFDDQSRSTFPMVIAARMLEHDTSPLEVVNDIWTNVTWARELAKVLVHVALHDVPFRLYHVANPGELTWLTVAERIAETLSRRGMRCRELRGVSKTAWYHDRQLNPDLYPNYTCLELRRYLDLGGPEMSPWTRAVDTWCNSYLRQYLPGG